MSHSPRFANSLRYCVYFSLALIAGMSVGCSNSDTADTSKTADDAKLPFTQPADSTTDANGADPAAAADDALEKSESLATTSPAAMPDHPTATAESAIVGEAVPAGEAIPVGAPQPDNQAPNLLTMADPAAASETADPKRRQLRANLTPDELHDFLAGADSDIQAIASGASGIQDPKEAFAEMRRISQMKLEAARRLQNHADANADARSEGARGELQSLSHLAALGDLKSAMELEKLATANLDSVDPRLVTDSRLVLIGFAIESLHNGDADAPQRIVQLVNGLATSDASSDIPAMMVMGQARQVLTQFDHDAEAKVVRNTIIELYADSSDPQIAKMAAQLAGNVQFDEIDNLLQLAIDGESIDTNKWTDAVQALLTASPDLQTVQYLAGAALQFEGLNQQDLAEATYNKLQEQFPDTTTATGQEVQLAISARKSRVDAIGKTFDPDLKSIDGGELSIADYRGKIVLMPLWAMGFQESLQLIPHLQDLQQQSPDDIAIVGVNLDPAGAPVAEFVQQNKLDFSSYRAVSSATAEVPNEVAARFGMVSMPFLVVLDQEGRVASIDYTIAQLQQTLKRLQN